MLPTWPRATFPAFCTLLYFFVIKPFFNIVHKYVCFCFYFFLIVLCFTIWHLLLLFLFYLYTFFPTHLLCSSILFIPTHPKSRQYATVALTLGICLLVYSYAPIYIFASGIMHNFLPCCFCIIISYLLCVSLLQYAWEHERHNGLSS